jgi:hypothetical protein
MPRTFIEILCGTEPLAFVSDFGLYDSVRRLAAEVKPPLIGLQPVVSFKTTAVVGQVAEEYVSLWCERLFLGNGFKPRFIGRFQIFDNRVILIGKMIGMNGLVHLWVGGGLAMGLFFTLVSSLELIRGAGANDPALWVMPFAGILPPLFTLGTARLGTWLSSGDEDWILAAIRSAILRSEWTSV